MANKNIKICFGYQSRIGDTMCEYLQKYIENEIILNDEDLNTFYKKLDEIIKKY